MVKDHSDSERGNLLPPLHGLLFPISSKGSFICTIPDRTAHTMAFVTPVVEHWLEQDIAKWVDPTTHHTMSERSYHRATSHSYPTKRIAHISAFVIPVMEHWLEREIAQWVIRRPIAP